MNLTKKTLRGVIKEVLKETTGLAGEAGDEATRSRLALGMKEKIATWVQNPEVKPIEIKVMATIIDTLMELAGKGNLASGTAQSVLKAAIAKLDRAVVPSGGSDSSGAAEPPDENSPEYQDAMRRGQERRA